MKSIQISVIIPVYNGERFIEKCLDSLSKQTMNQIEIIVINDGSTDATAEILENYQKECKMSLKIFTRKNAGQAAARNFGIQQAVGKYLAFMDSDDYVERDYLQRLYETALKYDADVVTCGYRSVNPDGKVLQTVSVSPFGEVTDYGKPGVFVVWAKLFLRQFILDNQFEFPEGGKIYEDVPFSLETKFKGKNVKAISYIGYNYVQHGASTMSSSKVTCARFPFNKVDEAIRSTVIYPGVDKERFEFEVIHFFAGFLFLFCKKAKKEDVFALAEFAEKEITTYFPQYWKNNYIGIMKVKELPIMHRLAIWIFVKVTRIHFLKPFAYIITR